MNKISLAAGAALLAIAGTALAQPGDGPRRDRNADVTRQQVIDRVDQRFAALDADRDGRVTPEEMRQHGEQRRSQRAERMFDRLDANRDGSITREEWTQARAQRAERMAERRAQAGPGERAAHMRGMRAMRGMRNMRAAHGARMFAEQGYVTREQMRERALAGFDRLDANRDGTVTAAERQQARQQMREQVRQRVQERRSQAQ
ncbi:MAG: EF-hand domain-containing protein [Sphingomonas sp.]|nr:EF-hand domain-containing protein [Sphingomonas sp.]